MVLPCRRRSGSVRTTLKAAVLLPFLWSLHATCASAQAPLESIDHIEIDISEQKMYVFDAQNTVIAKWPVSTGAKSTPTPLGSFFVTTKSRSTFSTPNPEVTMQWMTRFRGNYGIHAIPRRSGKPLWTPLGKAGVSHGCVRIADNHAKLLYELLRHGSSVKVRP